MSSCAGKHSAKGVHPYSTCKTSNPSPFKVSRYSGKDEVMPEEKIVFVNSEPAKCGCKMEFSPGGGHYSDVLYVTPCQAHSGSKQFGPAEVKRDGNGWWWHQGIPDFGGTEDPAPYHAWLAEEGLELREWSMERDLDNHPYFDGTVGCEGCRGWDPQSPGPEWFLLGIFDTEDGPHVHWARRVTP